MTEFPYTDFDYQLEGIGLFIGISSSGHGLGSTGLEIMNRPHLNRSLYSEAPGIQTHGRMYNAAAWEDFEITNKINRDQH